MALNYWEFKRLRGCRKTMTEADGQDLVKRFGAQIDKGRFTIQVGDGILHDTKSNKLLNLTQADLEILVLLDENHAIPRWDIENQLNLEFGKKLDRNATRQRLDDLMKRCPGVIKTEGKKKSNNFSYRLARKDED